MTGQPAQRISPLPINMDWRIHGKCRTVDPDVMYPDENDQEGNSQAKAVCSVCSVKDQCRAEALTNREAFGVWGGLTERERRSLDRKQRRGSRRPPTHHVRSCGTAWGASVHYRDGERACPECLAANRERAREIREKRRQ